MKEKGMERTEEAGITLWLCLEHRSLESADMLLQDNQYALIVNTLPFPTISFKVKKM